MCAGRRLSPRPCALGAPAPFPRATTPLLAWEDKGAGGTACQSMKSTVRFDRRNRMHLATTINGDDSLCRKGDVANSMTHVLYARSDDGGATFRKADGGPIERLPVRTATADLIAANVHWLSMMTSMMFDPQDNVSMPDAPANVKAFKRPASWRAKAAWPQMKVVTLTDTITHGIRSARMAPCGADIPPREISFIAACSATSRIAGWTDLDVPASTHGG